jgi:hypothetical protein
MCVLDKQHPQKSVEQCKRPAGISWLYIDLMLLLAAPAVLATHLPDARLVSSMANNT